MTMTGWEADQIDKMPINCVSCGIVYVGPPNAKTLPTKLLQWQGLLKSIVEMPHTHV